MSVTQKKVKEGTSALLTWIIMQLPSENEASDHLKQ